MSFWQRNYADKPLNQLDPCNAPSPDASLTCTKEIGHLGWHADTTSDTSWFMDTWAVDEFADTAEAAVDPEPTMTAEEWERLNKPKATTAPPPTAEEPNRRRSGFSRPQKAAITIIPHKNPQIMVYRAKLAEAKLHGRQTIIYPALTAGKGAS